MVFTKTEPNIMPRQSAAAAPVAPTPQMQMPLARPVIAAPQPQQQPTVQPDAVPQPAAPQQPAVQTPQAEMPTGQPYTDYMRKPDIQPGTPISVVPPTVPQEQIQSQRLDQMKGAPVSVVPAVPEPNQEPLQTKALEQANPGYWQKYGGINWNANGGDFFSNLSEANIPIQDAIKYYDAFQKDNGGKELDPWDVWARLGDKDFTKSKKQQDEEDKKLERQQKWEKIGNVFNHLANLWGTMRGAPGMQLESGEALTKRQQEQVDRVKALRQVAGKRYLDALQQKKAEEFKRKQLENEAARLAENQRRNDLMDAYRQEELARRKKADEEAAKAKAAETARKTKEGEERNERAKERNKAAQTSANASASRANTGRQKYEDSKNSREKIIEEKQGRKKIVYKEKEVNPGRPKKRKLGLY